MSGKKLFRSALSIIITNVDIIFNKCQPFVNDNSIKKVESERWKVEICGRRAPARNNALIHNKIKSLLHANKVYTLLY